MADNYLTVAQLATELGVSLQSAYELLWKGRIPSQVIGRSRIIWRVDLEAYQRTQQEKERVKK